MGNEPTTQDRPIVTRFSSEYDGPRQFYLGTGEEVPQKPLEQNVSTGKYKPEYDFETWSIKHWWFKNESELFRDVYTKVATFRSRTTIGKYWKALRIMLFDKYIGRFLDPKLGGSDG